MKTDFLLGRTATLSRLATTVIAAAVLLAGCGGGGGSSSAGSTSGSTGTGAGTGTGGTVADVIPTENEVWNTYWNMCAKPRTGLDPYTGKPYPDKQGTLLDEMKFLRGWANTYYLWYNEIPTTIRMANYTSALDYFAVLKTNALTASGQPKDKYHFTYPTAEWDALSNAGVEFGYGITWSRGSTTAPRTWLATVVEPGSPAAAAGVRRGDLLLNVDGVDFVNGSDAASVDKINAGLFPATAGEQHRLTLRRNGASFDVTVKAADVSADPVKSVQVLDTASGKVGYLDFESHNAVSEKELVDAFTQLKTAGVSDLVLDMRYNSGGLLYVASELAYMIAGPTVTAGKVFERPQYNDKTPVRPQDTIGFMSTAYGFGAPNPVQTGTPLPYLGLKRVTVLTTSGTCSASEAVINGLRGVDVQVNIIGDTTCGKPYAFTPTPNCGTTYFSIEFKGVNEKGYGDYADGMAPTCRVGDDLTHAIGDPQEGLLAAALKYNATGVCPAPSSYSAMQSMKLVRSEAASIALMPPRRAAQ
jgi:hypothetical protein